MEIEEVHLANEDDVLLIDGVVAVPIPYIASPKRKQVKTKSQVKSMTAYNREKRVEIKLRAIKYKGGKCIDCGGVFHPVAYDFHHLDPSKKDMQISKFTSISRWDEIEHELDKCILLCSNCHRVRHWGQHV